MQANSTCPARYRVLGPRRSQKCLGNAVKRTALVNSLIVAVAVAGFLGRGDHSEAEMRGKIGQRFGYDLDRTLADIRPSYSFDVSCQGSVPESIIAFLESNSVEDAIRKAISLGGDTDTMGCIAGGIAEAFYGEIPPEIISEVQQRLPDEFLTIIDTFHATFK